MALALVMTAAVVVAAATTLAQGSNPQRLFREAQAREATVRRQLDTPGPGIVAVLPRLRTLVGTYQDLARLFPASPVADDALWQGARLSADAFWQAGEAQDRDKARRMFQALTTSFPQSELARQVPAQTRRLDEARLASPAPAAPAPSAPPAAHAPVAGAVVPPVSAGSSDQAAPVPGASIAARAPATPASAPVRPATPSSTAGAPARSAAAARTTRPAPVTLTGIRREVLPEALRITLDVEQETAFRAERLDAPARVFIDLKNTRAVDALKDAVLPYADGVVRQVRVGRQPDQRTRVVFDLHGSPRHSVYTLYDPYRIVIDFEQPAALGGAASPALGVPVPATPQVPVPQVAPVSAAASAAAVPESAPVSPAPRRVMATLERADRTATSTVRVTGRKVPTSPVTPAASTAGAPTSRPSSSAPAAATPPPAVPLPSTPVAADPDVAAPDAAPSTVVAHADAGTPSTTPPGTAGGTSPRPPRSPKTNMRGGYSLSRQLGLGIARIVIDPGHGGHDPGAKARGLTEADLVLDVALRLEALLAAQPGVEVVLTRRTNSYVSLEDRTDIANRADADLFLSIHANASANTRATGIESYFLNFAPDKAAEAAAARENAASGRSMRHLDDIVKAIALDDKRDESRDLATMVQAALHGQARRSHREIRNLGVKQAPFMVLIGATMPSVLTEIAFITNQQELTLLKTDAYRQRIAEGLLAGITRYQQSLKQAPAVARN